MSGYIGNIPVPQATQSREVFTATSGQTTFATVGYPVGFVDCFLNGVKLINGTDFTATNGSDVVLTVGAATGDTVEVISNSTFEVNSQTFTGGLTVNNDAATVLTVDRATSDGTLVDFKKDGVSRGQIKMHGDRLVVGSGDASLKFDNGTNDILPWNIGTDAAQDNTVDLGSSTARFNELFLGGGVYLGGTGAANLLDDYEEGTFTPSWGGSATAGTVSGTFNGTYTKIGRVVYCTITLSACNLTGASGALQLTGLPFSAASGNLKSGGTAYLEGVTPSFSYTPQTGSHVQVYVAGSSTTAQFRVGLSAQWDNYLNAASTFTSGGGSTYGTVSITYTT